MKSLQRIVNGTGRVAADDRLTAFVTHAGAGSVLEAATSGVPSLVVPIFGKNQLFRRLAKDFQAEQPHNALTLSRTGMARIFYKEGLRDPTAFAEAIERLLGDET